MRQYGEVPPWLAAVNTPKVQVTTGLGTGGGASVQTPDSGGFGEVLVTAGVGVLASGNVVILFPSTGTPTLFISGDEAFGAITQSVDDPSITIFWTGAKMIAGRRYRISYEWAVSK